MVKNYKTTFIYIVWLLESIVSNGLSAQEVKIFSVGDFDLKGAVKSCLVITDYGKEEYDFDEDGLLTKAVTRYSDSDYDITLYKLNGRELLEKRLENYREGTFVRNTSIANLYERDTTDGLKVTEKIISYNSEFLDQYEYIYDENGRMTSIRRTNNKGIDQTTVTYEENKTESTETYYLNDVIYKSVRTSVPKNDKSLKTILAKEFMEGRPQFATERTFNGDAQLISEIKFTYSDSRNSFIPVESVFYTYGPQGSVTSQKTQRNGSVMVKEYLYQYDDGGKG
ncbi:MAG TPA: hypothetical protein VLZ54_11780, partial [Arenibacter sp.]|nr:hypothetical protein [Arenibacter sp.]